MDETSRILIVGGMAILAFGFLLGIPMTMARDKAPRAPRYLVAAHLAAIMQGGALLAVTIAVGFSALSALVETIAASLLVGGVMLFDLGLALNWLQGVEDAFEERSLGHKVSSVGAPLVLLGAGIVFFGVVAAL